MERSLELNPNDADSLVMIASNYAFHGEMEKALDIWQRATELNPYFDPWYYAYGGFIKIMQGEFEEGIELALKAPLTTVWIDLASFISVAYAYLGNAHEAGVYRKIFLEAYREKILKGREPDSVETFEWLLRVNPFKRNEESEFYQKGLKMAGFLDGESATDNPSVISDALSVKPAASSANDAPKFRMEADIRHISFQGIVLQLPEMKGFGDMEELIRRSGEEVHCTELMGSISEDGESAEVMDMKTRQDCGNRIRELQLDLIEAEEANDSHRAEKIREELDPLIDHLAKAVGIGGKSRRLAAPAERARSAVTWRIRNAIKKIEAADQSIGRHFKNSIRTGTFCSYEPEGSVSWEL